jgi:ribonuclease VapC
VIVLDSSILVGIIKGEKDAEKLLDLLAGEESVIGTPTLVETRAWCTINLAAGTSAWLEHFIGAGPGAIVPFSREMADAANRAFAAFGRASGHPARLNFGDCMAYAVSAILQAPLLFKGGDFGLTDVLAHPASIRT